MSQNKTKELKPSKVYTEERISKAGKPYFVLVCQFELGGGGVYTVENFLNEDQRFILGA